jgi:hypothetical protein
LRSLQKQGLITFGYRKLGEKEQVPAVRVEPEAKETAEARELARLLGLKGDKPIYTINSVGRRTQPDSVGIELRSLVGIMFFLSTAVDIPERDLALGRVTVARDAEGRPFDWTPVVGDLLDIKSQDEKPANAAISVQYRGSWFYIDDSDMDSKYTFMLLGTLIALQAGDIERAGPLLTLPVTGS